ncbi:hypothetical protein RHGRI_001427 [Rhododendron griersonianum]|uniref:Uncharacterized protein n=1 Tax=Rhododendron griersonianum TaxID=479676 RepID=A0AAV6LNA9_9ERIC|nr:hypothetical protein RHGRI_001427 [Rhododendron griersonianum]
MHCIRHANSNGGKGMALGLQIQGVTKAWQTDCLSPGKAMDCSRQSKIRGGQGMTSQLLVTGQGDALLTAFQNKGWPRGGQGMTNRLLVTGQGNALLTVYQDQGWPKHDSRHAKTRGGLGMASRLLVTGQGNAMLKASQNKGWPRNGKPIACHRARQCIDHGMPRLRVAKAWQADCLSPGKAMRCSRQAKERGGQGLANQWPTTGEGNAVLTACQNLGWPRHSSQHAKTWGCQGMASRLLISG